MSLFPIFIVIRFPFKLFPFLIRAPFASLSLIVTANVIPIPIAPGIRNRHTRQYKGRLSGIMKALDRQQGQIQKVKQANCTQGCQHIRRVSISMTCTLPSRRLNYKAPTRSSNRGGGFFLRLHKMVSFFLLLYQLMYLIQKAIRQILCLSIFKLRKSHNPVLLCDLYSFKFQILIPKFPV